MSNVVDLFSRVTTDIEKTESDEAHNFIQQFYDWAVEQGIDVTDTDFKYDAAVIMTSIQSIMHKRKKRNES